MSLAGGDMHIHSRIFARARTKSARVAPVPTPLELPRRVVVSALTARPAASRVPYQSPPLRVVSACYSSSDMQQPTVDFSHCVSPLDDQRQMTIEAMMRNSASKPTFVSQKSSPLHGGRLEIVQWYGERMLRIWTPPGYDKADMESKGGYPVLYLHDGQNVFDPSLCMSGHCWEAATTGAALIREGKLPPFVIVGVDHTGITRSYDYNPYIPGTGPESFRKDAAKWPGGGANQYLDRLVNEVMPFATKQYGLSSDSALIAIGGSSFGGIVTLCMAMRYPNLFGSALVESPSLWVNDAKFLNEDIKNYSGPLPERIFVAMGDKEYSGIRADDNKQADEWLAKECGHLGDMLESKGLKRGEQLWCEIEEGATHNEYYWAKRLPRALTFLCSHWKSCVASRTP